MQISQIFPGRFASAMRHKPVLYTYNRVSAWFCKGETPIKRRKLSFFRTDHPQKKHLLDRHPMGCRRPFLGTWPLEWERITWDNFSGSFFLNPFFEMLHNPCKTRYSPPFPNADRRMSMQAPYRHLEKQRFAEMGVQKCGRTTASQHFWAISSKIWCPQFRDILYICTLYF